MVTSQENTPRARVVRSAAELIRAQGVSGTGLREVVAAAEAPWGSLQHYFPGGKEQVVREAVEFAGAEAAARVTKVSAGLRKPTPGALFAGLADQWKREFQANGYACGSALLATTADIGGGNDAVRAAVASAYAAWQEPVIAALRSMGVTKARATALATLIVSALEGAVVLARAQQDTAPLTTVVRELRPLLDGAV